MRLNVKFVIHLITIPLSTMVCAVAHGVAQTPYRVEHPLLDGACRRGNTAWCDMRAGSPLQFGQGNPTGMAFIQVGQFPQSAIHDLESPIVTGALLDGKHLVSIVSLSFVSKIEQKHVVWVADVGMSQRASERRILASAQEDHASGCL